MKEIYAKEKTKKEKERKGGREENAPNQLCAKKTHDR
jgi:hypothetical protein